MYSYRNYDKVVLDEVSSRTKNKIKLEINDISIDIKKKLNIPNSLMPSIKNLINVFDISIKNDHDALNDAEALYELYTKIFDKNTDYKIIERKMAYEYMRPRGENKLTSPYIKGEVEEQKINNNYKIVFNNSIVSKIKKKMNQ